MVKFLQRLYNRRNRGSSLTTIIIVCAFISILATVSLYISGVNAKMKAADYSTKKVFYNAEEVVELFETALVQDVSAAADEAYKSSGCRYIELQEATNRTGFYYDNFKDSFKDAWEAHWKSTSTTDETDLVKKGIGELFPSATYTVGENVVVVSSGAQNITYSETTGVTTFEITLNGQKLYCTINAGANSTQSELLGEGRFAYIHSLDMSKCGYSDDTKSTITSYQIVNLDLTVTNASASDTSGYTSHIITSFKITPPAVNWSEDTAIVEDTAEAAVISSVDFAKSVSYINWSKE